MISEPLSISIIQEKSYKTQLEENKILGKSNIQLSQNKPIHKTNHNLDFYSRARKQYQLSPKPFTYELDLLSTHPKAKKFIIILNKFVQIFREGMKDQFIIFEEDKSDCWNELQKFYGHTQSEMLFMMEYHSKWQQKNTKLKLYFALLLNNKKLFQTIREITTKMNFMYANSDQKLNNLDTFFQPIDFLKKGQYYIESYQTGFINQYMKFEQKKIQQQKLMKSRKIKQSQIPSEKIQVQNINTASIQVTSTVENHQRSNQQQFPNQYIKLYTHLWNSFRYFSSIFCSKVFYQAIKISQVQNSKKIKQFLKKQYQIQQDLNQHYNKNKNYIYQQNFIQREYQQRGYKLSPQAYYLVFSQHEINMKDFSSINWNHLEYLSLWGCNLTNEDWNIFVENAHNFRNIKYLGIVKNEISSIKEGDLDNFSSLRYLNMVNNHLKKEHLKVFQNYKEKHPQFKLKATFGFNWIDL